VDAAQAARANGFSAHLLDFDDTCYDAGVIHPSAVLYPVALGLGEELNADGRSVLTAYIAGLEVAGRIGLAAGDLFRKGWFTTSVFGVAGAAVTAAKLLRLDTDRIQNAIGLALSQAAGIRQNNGTPGKPFAVGRAAENGILTARLAEAGLSASPAIMEGPDGFFEVYCNGNARGEVLECPGEPWVILDPGISFKPYPTCSSAHAAMEATRMLAADNKIIWPQVERVTCTMTPTALHFLPHDRPQSTEHLLFSLPFCIACILKEGNLQPGHLSEQYLRDRDIQELMTRVEKLSTEGFPDYGRTEADCPEGAQVVLETKDGHRFTTFLGDAKGSVARPFSPNEFSEKFRVCAQHVLPSNRIERWLSCVAQTEHLGSIRELIGLLVP
jgi:2-methylcitrate dehydratase PrpD